MKRTRLLTLAVLVACVGALASGPGRARAGTSQRDAARTGSAPQAAGDDIDFAHPNAVLRTIDRVEFYTVGLAAGDFNGDGKLDLATVGNERAESQRTLEDVDRLYVMLGNGNGTFQGVLTYPATTGPVAHQHVDPHCPIARDFDGDGKLDILAAALSSPQLMFFKGRGDGSFRYAVSTAFPTQPNCLRVADLNGDGKLDAISWDFSTNKVMTAFGNGNGTFAAPVSYTAHGNVGTVLSGDINGDGKLDLVYSAYNNTKFGMMLNDGSGGFPATPTQVGIGGGAVMNIALADYSGDNKLDVLAGNNGAVNGSTSWSAVLVRGNGNGTFQTPVAGDYINNLLIVPGMMNTSMPDAPDFNADGRPDFVAGNGDQDYNALTIALNNGSGGFGARRKWVTSSGAGASVSHTDRPPLGAYVAADFNGDGKMDIATSYGNSTNAGHVDLMLGKGNGLFESSQLVEDSYTGRSIRPRSSALFDFTGDGKRDLLSVSNGIAVLQAGDGAGGFDQSGYLAAPNGNGYELVTGDVDGNGTRDIVYGTGGGQVTVGLNNGSGTFTYNSFITTNAARSQVYQMQALADFNGDGKLDIAIKQIDRVEIVLYPFPSGSGATPNATLTISPGDLTADGAGHYPLNIAHAADLDGDGKVDLLVHSRNGAADNLEFFKGAGNGTFAAAVSAGNGYGDVSSMATMDLDGDGKLDLLAAGAYDIWYAKGVGDGMFFAPVSLGGVLGGSQEMAVVDFNSDGKPDIGTTYIWGVAVYPGKGAGAFGPVMYLARGSSAGSEGGLAVGDVNGDSKPDIVSLRSTSGDDRFYAAVLLNTSGAKANLKLALKASRQSVAVNTPSYFIATVTNTGGSTASNVTLRNLLPAADWSVDSAVASQGSCDGTAGAGVLNCVLGSMPVSTTQTVTISARPLTAAVLAATASVSSTVADPDLSDNGSSASVVGSPPVPAFVLSASAGAASGSTGTNANNRPVIVMPKRNVRPVTGKVRIDKSKLPNGLPSTSTVTVISIYNGKTYVMVETQIDIIISDWTVTIPAEDVVEPETPVITRILICTITCNPDGTVTVDFERIRLQLIDPSGIVSDRVTGQPIRNARVTLYKVPGAMPDEGAATNQCRTIDTRPGGAGGNWDGLPAANPASGVLPNLFFDPGEISPAINPQTTGADGRYAWDVVKGCWFVKVEAPGYKTVVSPVVGVPPEVTDLHIKMDRGSGVYLPLVRK